MRVLMLTGESGTFGGHAVQREQTTAALSDLGLSVESSDEVSDRSDFDVVHAWWPDPAQVRKARRLRLPVAASTIYIPTSSHMSLPPWATATSRARMGAGAVRKAALGRHMEMAETLTRTRRDARLLFESADLLLPNSRGEADLIGEELGVTTPRWVVRNGLDPRQFNQTATPDWSERRGVLIAARIEPHKNQLAVIKALAGTDIPVYVAGGAHPHHPDYFKACHQASLRSANVSMLGRLAPTDLSDLMRRVRVHVLPSQWETTGLSSLEAAACGCNVVVSDRGHVREYLRDEATYCDLSVHGIRQSVIAAHGSPQQAELADRSSERFTWKQAARDTLGAYRWLLSDRRAEVEQAQREDLAGRSGFWTS